MVTKSFSVSQAELEKRGKLLKKNTQLKRFVDLNTDIAQTRDLAFWESEEAESLLSSVSSVNLPCFVHDGVPDKVLEQAVKAKAFGCALGAHIAYPDPVSMGYEQLPLSHEQLEQWILVQLGALSAVLKPEALKVFSAYLLNCQASIKIYTDARSLIYAKRMSTHSVLLNSTLNYWHLQEYTNKRLFAVNTQ